MDTSCVAALREPLTVFLIGYEVNHTAKTAYACQKLQCLRESNDETVRESDADQVALNECPIRFSLSSTFPTLKLPETRQAYRT